MIRRRTIESGAAACLALLGVTACAPAAPRATPPPALLAADSAHSLELAPGVGYTAFHLAEGPWRGYLVEVSPATCGVEFRAATGDDHAVGRERTSEMARRIAATYPGSVLAGINADFFSFTPPGVPDGPHISEGLVTAWGEHPRPAFGVTRDGTPYLAEVALDAGLRTRDGFVAPIARANPREPGEGLTLYTDRFARSLDSTEGANPELDPGDVGLELRMLTPPPLVGDTARGIVVALGPADQQPAGLSGGSVRFLGRGPAATFLESFVAVGDTLRWLLSASDGEASPLGMVAGRPMLLRGGVPLLDGHHGLSASFVTTRHPRSAIAMRPDGSVLILVVDGRAPGYSEGMSLHELTDLLLALGASDALNLDGGGSTTLVLGDRVVNRPTDQEGERAVGNALFILEQHSATCAPDPRSRVR